MSVNDEVVADSSPRGLTRRTFTFGALGAAAGSTVAGNVLAQAPASAALGRSARPAHVPFFDETTMWDSEIGPRLNYHVHGLAVLPDDTILVATEGRFDVCDAGPRELLLRRSVDGGDTWEDNVVVHPSIEGQSWGNPTFVVDHTTGEVFFFFMLSILLPENTGCSGDIGDLYMKSSTDGGQTWSAARDISGMFDHFPYDWALHGPGPGHGIQLATGRLLLQVSHRRVVIGNTVNERFYGVSTLYSDDHGATWQAGGAIPVSVDYPLNESRLVELSDGRILINARASSGGNRHRITSVSNDGGVTWAPPKLDGATGMFNAVDAGMLRYTGGPGSDEISRILYSKPDAPVRRNMTVYVSYDEVRSLRYARVVNSDRSYYSDLARLSDGTIILLYGCEGNIPSAPKRVAVARFNLAWLTDGQDDLLGNTVRASVANLEESQAAVSAGTVASVADPLASGGERVVFTPTAVGDFVEFPFVAPGPWVYEIWLRYFRPVGGGLFSVQVDGEQPERVAYIDSTLESAEGYDSAYLGERLMAPGASHTVRVTFEGAGRSGGTSVSIDALSLVKSAHRPDLRDEDVVDNAQLGWQLVSGTWGTSAAGTQGAWNSNYRHHARGTGSSVVRWRPVVPHTGRYEIQSSILPFSNRATNAPFTVHYGDGTSTTVRINQQVAGEWDPRGTQWQSLGEFDLIGGISASVELSDDADGFVAADAIRILPR